MTLVGYYFVTAAANLAAMLNLIPISAITNAGVPVVDTIECPLCHSEFPTEKAKTEHLEKRHPNWAMSMMFAFLRQIPRENG